jgi:hypothetical protein
MGSLYRSKHELIFVFKAGSGPHVNNVELGRQLTKQIHIRGASLHELAASMSLRVAGAFGRNDVVHWSHPL